MKKINLLLLLLLIAFSTNSFATAVSVSAAKNVGYNYLKQHSGNAVNSMDDLKLVYTSGSPTPFFYIFSGEHCFVIISAEDGVTPVIGYSTDRAFLGDHVPNTVTSFFESYNNQINYVITHNIAASEEIATDWNDLANNRVSHHSGERTTAVGALMSTTWDQSQYYNSNCPADPGAPFGYGGRVPTGCVATATAQIMKFWNWPTTGVGTHSYATSSYGTLSANFGTTTYNWAAMPNNVTSSNPSVAKLMSDVGISINMDYSPTESSAYVISSSTGTAPYCAEYSLKNFFNYDPALHGVQRASYSDATWISMLEGELNAGRPILYAGFGTGGGHCFVLDGYDASNKMHVNWGWSGSGPDGYYMIDALNPPSLGTGGGAGGFNSGQQAVLGIKPPVTVGGTADTIAMYDYEYTYTPSVFYADSFSIVANIANYANHDFSGDIGVLAFDATGTFVGVVDSFIGVTLPTLTYTGDIVFHTNGMISMMPGTYTVGVFYRHSGGLWQAVWDNPPYTNGTTVTVYNNNFIELYTAMTPSPSPMVQGSAASVSLKIYNDPTFASAWTDSLYLGIYNLDGSYNSDIGYIASTSLASGATSGVLNFSTPSITATPGTYILVLWFKYSGGWYIAGADYHVNPQYVTIVAPPPSPDVYEVNNTAGTAYDLSSTLTWTGGVAHTSTPGSNFHISTDQDYYKVVLPSGYHYTITARINDDLNKDDAGVYTVDGVWSYSTDMGATWSPVYDATMPGTINIPGLTGGTVIFHCSPKYAGSTGDYLFKIGNITRSTTTTNLPEIDLSAARIYPNPASTQITVDLSIANTHGLATIVSDVLGKTVYSADMNGEAIFTVPVSSFAPGVYFIQVATENGIINKQLTVGK